MRLYKKILVCVFLIFSLLLGVVWYAYWVAADGEKKSRWIREEMWAGNYFNGASGKLSEEERINIFSLKSGSSMSDSVVSKTWESRCDKEEYSCLINKLSLANFLIDSGNVDSAFKLIEEARNGYGPVGFCEISLESSLLRYKLFQVLRLSRSSAEKEVSAVVSRIKEKGGLMFDLRKNECNRFSREKTELFHEYVVLVSRLMSVGGTDVVSAGVYIDSKTKLK